jgi:thioesterase domain-containing protein
MSKEKDLAERRSRLSPSKLALLQKRLGGESAEAHDAAGVAARPPQPARGRSPLVPLQPAGARPPFFCVHPSSGSVFGYLDLARRLGTDQPFYGLQSPGLDGGAEAYGGVEEMAADYVAALLALDPRGPYLLGGWSLGGVIAYEMARQLAAQGRRTDLLALFDIHPRSFGRALTPEDYSLEVNWFIAELARAFGKASPALMSELQALEPDERVRYALEQAGAHGLIDEAELAQLQLRFRVFKSNLRAAAGYTPQGYSGRVTVFRAAGEADGAAPPRLEANELAAGGVETYDVPGRHQTMLREPHVGVLARRLSECLSRGVGSS